MYSIKGLEKGMIQIKDILVRYSKGEYFPQYDKNSRFVRKMKNIYLQKRLMMYQRSI